MRAVSMLVVVVVLLGACGSDGSGGTTPPAAPVPGEDRARERPDIDPEAVEAANAAVPPGTDLRFEAAEWGEEDLLYLRPVGWTSDEGADLTFTSEAFSIFTMYRIGKSCDGVCAPGKDWEARQDDLLAPVLDPERYKIIDDRRLADPDGRTVISRARGRADDPISRDPEVRIMTIRWEQEAATYFECFVVLSNGDQQLSDAFAHACEAAVPLDFDALSIKIGRSGD